MALPKYNIPRELERAVKESERSGESNSFGNKFFPVLIELKRIDSLKIEKCHYLQFLKLGLYLEEYQQRKDMEKFEIHESTIEKVKDSEKRFKIYINGLNENNSKLSVSDSLEVYEKNDSKTVFLLKVLKICNGHIIVTADSRFCKKHKDSGEYSVVLIFNEYTFQCCHYALSEINSSMISNYFFPKKTDDKSYKLNTNNYIQKWINNDIENNPEQKQAVYNILNKSALPAPYILYGPPGTGKTSTIVEAICQVWIQKSSNYILVCAPSNAACDVVTKRLLDYIPTKNLYRIYSQSQEYSLIDDDIKKCCNHHHDGTVDDIEKVDMTFKNIIITTICTSLRLQKLKLHFSHVFIDEASQATLPEAFLPLCAAKSSQSFQIVISGDHQQLGPGIRSKLAEPLLGQSILEKLMKHDPYIKDDTTGYDRRYITKLIRNFRSSEDIIHVPNVLFYDNELIACNNTKLSAFPVAFYAAKGKERKMSNSKSSCNQVEIDVVINRVKSFVGKRIGSKIITKKDIGIVTPFSLQVSQIRKKLDCIGFKDVDVGTVEIYQGQEKEVIIVSTVRSKTFIDDGVEHIGFLSNPRRFNVALTRAKTFLVVIGCPSVLATNKNWRYFLKFCQENNACHGSPFVIKDEHYYSMQELSIGIKSKKSTDLFQKTLKILKIDDGTYRMGNRRKNIQPSAETPTMTVIHKDVGRILGNRRRRRGKNIKTSEKTPNTTIMYSTNLSTPVSPIAISSTSSAKTPSTTVVYNDVGLTVGNQRKDIRTSTKSPSTTVLYSTNLSTPVGPVAISSTSSAETSTMTVIHKDVGRAVGNRRKRRRRGKKNKISAKTPNTTVMRWLNLLTPVSPIDISSTSSAKTPSTTVVYNDVGLTTGNQRKDIRTSTKSPSTTVLCSTNLSTPVGPIAISSTSSAKTPSTTAVYKNINSTAVRPSTISSGLMRARCASVSNNYNYDNDGYYYDYDYEIKGNYKKTPSTTVVNKNINSTAVRPSTVSLGVMRARYASVSNNYNYDSDDYDYDYDYRLSSTKIRTECISDNYNYKICGYTPSSTNTIRECNYESNNYFLHKYCNIL